MKALVALLLASLLIFTGCATSKKKADWPARVGSYTYDQCVAELGPPDKAATLTDGSRVVEWFVKQKQGMSVSFGVGSYGSNSAVGVGQTVGGIGGGQEFLQLTFDPTGTLRATQKITR